MPILQPVTVNFPEYQPFSDAFKISAAVVIPQGLRMMATSGHVGAQLDGSVPPTISEEIEVAFKNVEKAILAVSPSLTPEEAWRAVYQVNTYHAASESVSVMFTDVVPKYLGAHRPAWTALTTGLVIGNFEIAVFAAVP